MLGCKSNDDFSSTDNEALSKDKIIVIKDYYFPVTTFKSERIYEYTDRISGKSVNWGMTYLKQDEEYLRTIILDNKQDTLEVFTEKITNNGSVLDSYIVFSDGSQNIARVLSENVMSWRSDIGGKFIWSANYLENEDSIFISKSRTLVKDGMNIKLEGSKRSVIMFQERTIINIKAESDNFDYETTGESYFAKGIGLIETKTFEEGKLVSHLVLSRISPPR